MCSRCWTCTKWVQSTTMFTYATIWKGTSSRSRWNQLTSWPNIIPIWSVLAMAWACSSTTRNCVSNLRDEWPNNMNFNRFMEYKSLNLTKLFQKFINLSKYVT